MTAGRRSRRARAQSLVEFALVLPVFMVLLFAVVDFSRLLFSYISLTNGARELARVAAISSSTSNADPINAFNNFTLILGPSKPATDSVTVTVVDASGSSSSVTCTMPLQTASCTLPSRTLAADGYVDVSVVYEFDFSPLFAAPMGVVSMQQFRNLTTTVRSYVE